MSEINKDSKLKWSKVDLEVEKLKTQADIQAKDPIYSIQPKMAANNSYLENNLTVEDLMQEFGYDPYKEDLSTFLNSDRFNWDWNAIKNSPYDFLDIICSLPSDEMKLQAFEKYEKKTGRDFHTFYILLTSLNDDRLRISKIDGLQERIEEEYDGVFDEYTTDYYKDVYDSKNMLTENEFKEIFEEQLVAGIVSCCKNPELMIPFYDKVNNLGPKSSILQSISSCPEFSGELSTEELKEVSNRVSEEVKKIDDLNAQTREGIEEEIMDSLKQLTKAKQEYEKLANSRAEHESDKEH